MPSPTNHFFTGPMAPKGSFGSMNQSENSCPRDYMQRLHDVSGVAFCDASDRVRQWVLTGCHVIAGDCVKSKGTHDAGSHTVPTLSWDDPPDDPGGGSSSSSVSSASSDHLHGRDGDMLVPTEAEIRRMFHVSRSTWEHLVSRAQSIPSPGVPASLADPTVLLYDVPAVPKHKRSQGRLCGVPVWYRQTGEEDEETLVHGLPKEWSFWQRKPVAVRLSLDPRLRSRSSPPGLAILTLCWSYILCARLVQLQGLSFKYPHDFIRPELSSSYSASPTDYALDLSSPASDDLVRWLCAILAPERGWTAGRCPIWAARPSGDVRFVIVTDRPVLVDIDKPLPNASRAAALLAEFCHLFGLTAPGQTLARPNEVPLLSQHLAPYTAAFYAALVLPLYRDHGMEPQLRLEGCVRRESACPHVDDQARINQYTADLPYYMTLSADTLGLQSLLWSQFWQPDVPCPLVGPWLAGILHAIRPLVDGRDATTLAGAFALRRPRVAPWWLGLLLLGSPDAWDQMVLWLRTAEGRCGYGLAALSFPDITVSAWTNSPNSFWELGPGGRVDASHQSLRDVVPRVDVLRCRYNYNLRDESWNLATPWTPLGTIRKTEVEVDIWPSLERGFGRRYAHWIWQVDGHEVVQHGYRRDVGRTSQAEDDFGICDAGEDGEQGGSPPEAWVVPKRPTVVAVGRMLSSFMKDVRGDTHEDNAALPGFEKHRWHRYWNILPSGW
ncbi:hypothetical protein VTK73DRAFT_7936 [Phialemonium thermophilum]|uniref:Uncharacterized protein n=1 Tax=Phialemonium thermophilum TaxID=223376 RepID=A0ABR3WBK7_9PEZI